MMGGLPPAWNITPDPTPPTALPVAAVGLALGTGTYAAPSTPNEPLFARGPSAAPKEDELLPKLTAGAIAAVFPPPAEVPAGRGWAELPTPNWVGAAIAKPAEDAAGASTPMLTPT